jgi:hypothetical protein
MSRVLALTVIFLAGWDYAVWDGKFARIAGTIVREVLMRSGIVV